MLVRSDSPYINYPVPSEVESIKKLINKTVAGEQKFYLGAYNHLTNRRITGIRVALGQVRNPFNFTGDLGFDYEGKQVMYGDNLRSMWLTLVDTDDNARIVNMPLGCLTVLPVIDQTSTEPTFYKGVRRFDLTKIDFIKSYVSMADPANVMAAAQWLIMNFYHTAV